MPEVREVQQARASATKLATLVGKAGQWIIEKATWRPHIMDGATAGGHPVAFLKDLTDYENEVIQALEELIEENGGTVPTSLSENTVQTMSAQSADPWAEYD